MTIRRGRGGGGGEGVEGRPFDAVVIGGSFAGLAGALNIARTRRRVLVVDAGLPRNRFASHSHGVLAQDGRPGAEILAEARRQLAGYPSATVREGRVGAVSARDGEPFEVELEGGEVVSARRLLLATGMIDVLPEIPGVAERWGKTVLHCPYCHGYEVGGGPLGVVSSHPMAVHHAVLISDWGEVTLFTSGAVELDGEARATLARRGVTVEETPVVGMAGSAPALDGIELADGRVVPVRAAFVGAPLTQASSLAADLGCAFDDSPTGPIVRTDLWKLTTVPGVYAAGDAAAFPSNISMAIADGVRAGIGLHQSLVAEDSG
jgi:thioredoxin reductase